MGEGENEKAAAAVVLVAIMVIALAIIISQKLFPFFLVASAVTFVALVVSFIAESGIFSGEAFSPDFSLTPIIGIVFGCCVLGTLLTYAVGYGLGGTSFGKATVEAYQSITGAKQQVSESLNQAVSQVVDESCGVLSKESCDSLRSFAKTAKTLQEVSELAEQLKTVQTVAKAVR